MYPLFLCRYSSIILATRRDLPAAAVLAVVLSFLAISVYRLTLSVRNTDGDRIEYAPSDIEGISSTSSAYMIEPRLFLRCA